MTVEVSVVVPTFNRRAILAEVLEALDAQEDAPAFEVVVVDDGSTDGSPEAVEAWIASRSERSARPEPARRPRPDVRLLRQENRGPAAARNRGVTAARGPMIALLGDDTVPEPGWLAAHLAAHRARPGQRLAVIGYTAWHARMRPTPFLRYINEHGLQFGYALIADPENVPFNFFYTSNLSLARELLLEEPFDETFPFPAWEDIETSYRLFRGGMRLVYEPRARLQHDHPTDFSRFCRRQEQAGWSAAIFFRKHPELGGFLGIGPAGPGPVPSRLLQGGRECLVRALQFLPVSLPGLWDGALRYHYLRGLERAWREGPAGTERVGT